MFVNVRLNKHLRLRYPRLASMVAIPRMDDGIRRNPRVAPHG